MSNDYNLCKLFAKSSVREEIRKGMDNFLTLMILLKKLSVILIY